MSEWSMYLEAQKRYMAVTDAVFDRLANRDVLGLIEFVADVANGCDYVDDDSVAVRARAMEVWADRRAEQEPTS